MGTEVRDAFLPLKRTPEVSGLKVKVIILGPGARIHATGGIWTAGRSATSC